MIATKKNKQHRQHDECCRLEKRDGEQALIAQHAVLPPNVRHHGRETGKAVSRTG
jgi:hypothetical protein